jgi:hypothetical protein
VRESIESKKQTNQSMRRRKKERVKNEGVGYKEE